MQELDLGRFPAQDLFKMTLKSDISTVMYKMKYTNKNCTPNLPQKPNPPW